MPIIPLGAVPSQVATVALPSQNAQLSIYQRRTGLFIDVSVNDALIIAGVIGRDRVLIVRDAYLGFIGDLAFLDMQAAGMPTPGADPIYTGLGARFFLAWLAPGDLTLTSP